MIYTYRDETGRDLKIESDAPICRGDTLKVLIPTSEAPSGDQSHFRDYRVMDVEVYVHPVPDDAEATHIAREHQLVLARIFFIE